MLFLNFILTKKHEYCYNDEYSKDTNHINYT